MPPRKAVTGLVTELAELLRRQRTAAELTQEELAERSGVSARTISDTERGLRSTIYKDTALRLANALGMDGSSRDSFVAVARGHPAPSRESLPAPLTPLVGREPELAAVSEALRAVRLVTLTGAGGIGKTRLAIEATRSATDAVFVQLGPVEHASLVPSVVSHAVGGAATAGSPVDAIASQLRGRSVLLVLDTFEHLMDAAPFVTDLLERSESVRILATSRERLGLRREHEVSVPPLDAPRAAALFEERARATGAHTLDPRTVAEVCERLDGLPLAIELAAARLRHLPLNALREHLDHRLDVLKGGPRDMPSRQRTMRDTVAWSYELLDAQERALLVALSVFAGGWTLDAAGAVNPGAGLLDSLSALVDKSLVALGAHGRYRMLDVIREFVAEQGVVDARPHAEFFLLFAEEAEPYFGGGAQDAWFELVEEDHDNIRAALRFAIDEADANTAQRLAGAMWQFWRANGHVDEGRMWLRRALSLPSDDHARAKAMWGAAWLAYHQDDYGTANTLSIELLALARRSGDPTDTRNGLTVRGMVAMAEARYAEAVMSFEEALELGRSFGRVWLLATSAMNMATALMHAGDIDRARQLFREALNVYEELGDRRFAVRVQMHLAQTVMLLGDDAEARDAAVAVVSAASELGDEQSIAESLETLSAAQARLAPSESAFVAGAAAAMRNEMSIRPLPFDRALVDRRLAEGRAKLGAEKWDASFAEGLNTALERAIARVFGKED